MMNHLPIIEVEHHDLVRQRQHVNQLGAFRYPGQAEGDTN